MSVAQYFTYFIVGSSVHYLFHSYRCFLREEVLTISFFNVKSYVHGTHHKCLSEAFLMRTRSICFHGEKRLIYIGLGNVLLTSTHNIHICGEKKIHLYLVSHKRDIGKHGRPRSDPKGSTLLIQEHL